MKATGAALIAVAAVVMVGGGLEPAPASTTPAATAAPASGEELLPGAHELVSRSLDLETEASQARQQLSRIATTQANDDELVLTRARVESLRTQLDALERETYLRPERLTQLREQARLRRGDLESERQRLAERVETLDELRSAWVERRRFWTEWRSSLSSDKDVPRDTNKEFSSALRQIGEVLTSARERYSDALDRQRQLASLQRELLSIESHSFELIRQGRARRWQRDAPTLFSRDFGSRLAAVSVNEIREGIAGTPITDLAFLRRSSWALLLHALAIIGVAIVARRLHARAVPSSDAAAAFARPWLTGTFVATALASVLYQPMPALWELLLILTLAVTGALQASLVFTARGDQRLIRGLAIVYPLLFALEITAFPAPLFRLVFTLVCSVGAPLLLLNALRHEQTSTLARRVRIGTFVGAGLLFIALGGQLIGFEAFARWLLQATVATAFVAYIIAYLMRLGGTALVVLADAPQGPEAGFVERAGQMIASHARWIVRTALIVAAAIFVADVWGLIGSLEDFWNSLRELGVQLGETRLTLGRALVAILVLYATFVCSWVVRTLLDVHVFERREVEPGVGDSIKAILHYCMVVLGAFWALASLGISLQNFALIAGALSVGIGFGLQNIVNNFVSGLILLFERPVRVGDAVFIGGEWGVVRRIGLRSTVVQSFDRTELIVPNSDLVSEKVSNWTLSDRVTRVVIPVGVAYGSPVETVMEILKRVAREHPQTLPDPPVEILFMGFGDSSLDFEIRLWIGEALQKLIVRSDVLKAVDREFRIHDIEIPFPQRDLHLRSVDPDVALRIDSAKPS